MKNTRLWHEHKENVKLDIFHNHTIPLVGHPWKFPLVFPPCSWRFHGLRRYTSFLSTIPWVIECLIDSCMLETMQMDRPCVTCLLRFFKKNIHPSFVSPSTSAKVIRIVLLFPPCATASNNVPLYLPYIQPRPADMDNWFTILLVQPTNPSTHCKLSPNKTTHLNGKIHKLIP